MCLLRDLKWSCDRSFFVCWDGSDIWTCVKNFNIKLHSSDLITRISADIKTVDIGMLQIQRQGISLNHFTCREPFPYLVCSKWQLNSLSQTTQMQLAYLDDRLGRAHPTAVTHLLWRHKFSSAITVLHLDGRNSPTCGLKPSVITDFKERLSR
jgi:hypothetical protein